MPFSEGGLTTRSKMFRPKKRLQIIGGTADTDQSAASEAENNTPARSGSGAPTTNEDSGTAAERTTP